MKNYIYVLNKDGKPLMPTTAHKKVRRLLEEKAARIVSTKPFIIQLKYETTDYTQPLTLGIDPGRTNIGIAVIKDNGQCVFAAETETSNKDIPKLMANRKAFRQARRRLGRRKVRQRRACAVDPSLKDKTIERHLPGYSEDGIITCKNIKNKQAKFNNRRYPEGWLTPTANQLIQTHVNLVKKLQKILPITDIVLEINKFSFMKMENPGIKPWQYSKGSLYGYKNLHEVINDIQDNKCLLCGKHVIEHYHHIIPKHEGGSNTIDNMAGLCFCCHDKVHKEEKQTQKLKTKKAGLYKKYGALSVLNQIMPKLLTELSNILGKPAQVTDGRTTSALRTIYTINKYHYLDAYCIALSNLENEPVYIDRNIAPFKIKQYRRHDRQVCQQAMLNRKYYLNGELVAINRYKATEQKIDSLEEFRASYSKKLVSKLTIKEHHPIYKNMNRLYPGTRLYDTKTKEYFILNSYKNHQYYACNTKMYNPKYCVTIKHNAGLVFI